MAPETVAFAATSTPRASSNITDQWKFGWNVAVLSDKYYLNDYSIPTDTKSSNYFSESISTLYLTGQGDRSFFDLRGYYIQGLSSARPAGAAAAGAPGARLQSSTVDIDPLKSHGIGGQLEFDFNLTSPLRADSAAFQSVGPRTLDSTPSGSTTSATIYLPGRDLRQFVPVARHRRRLYARHRPWSDYQRKVHRSDRRGVDAVRLRPLQRRDGSTSTRRTPTPSANNGNA